MESDECYESVSSPGAEQDDQYSPPAHNLEPEKEFILKYQMFPQLWDTSDIRYSNRFERYQALAKLLPTYKKIKPYGTIDDIKKKINSLRSNYRRELKKYNLSKGTSSDYYPKVWYFPYLNFLGKLEDSADRGDSTSKKETQREEHFQTEERIQEKRPSILRSLCSETKQITPYPSLKVENKMFREQIRKEDRPAPYHHQYQCRKISNPLALEWSETLSRLDPLQRLYAKKAINDILFEAELGNLHKNSVRINEDIEPADSTPLSDPIYIRGNESTEDVDYKYPIAYLHCNHDNDGQPPKETEHGDFN